MFTLIIPECADGQFAFITRRRFFKIYLSDIHADHSIRDYSREKKKECRFITGTEREGGPCSISRDGERAYHLIDCARPRTRKRQL